MSRLSYCLILLLLLNTPIRANEPARIERDISIVDTGFDVYCAPELIGRAWRNLDASLMTDVALMLAHGESILQRSRAGLSFQEAAFVAAGMAARTGDDDSLKRLKQAADRLGSDTVTEHAAALLTGIRSGRDDTGEATPYVPSVDVQVSVADTALTEYELIYAIQDSANRAILLGDRELVTTLRDALNESPGISDAYRKILAQQLEAAATKLPEKPVLRPEAVALLTGTVVLDKTVANEATGRDFAVTSPQETDTLAVVDPIDLSGLNDPAFEFLVDFDRLGEALADGDAATIGDIAHQLGKAEEILLREHAKFKSDDLFVVAGTVAAKVGDVDALAAVIEAAGSRGNEQLSQQLKAVKSLSGTSRSVEPMPELAEDVDPTILTSVQELTDQLKLAELVGDEQSFVDLTIQLDVAALPQEQAEWFRRRIELAIDAIQQSPNSEHAQALLQLASESRQYFEGSPNSTAVASRSNTGKSSVGKAHMPAVLLPIASQYSISYGIRIDDDGKVFIGRKLAGKAKQIKVADQEAWSFTSPKGMLLLRLVGNRDTWILRPTSIAAQYWTGPVSGTDANNDE